MADTVSAMVASEPLQFILYGVVTDAAAAEPAMALTPVPTTPSPAPAKSSPPAAPTDDLVRPHPEARPGGIDIDLPTGVRLTVDSYVNEKALPACLRKAKKGPCNVGNVLALFVSRLASRKARN